MSSQALGSTNDEYISARNSLRLGYEDDGTSCVKKIAVVSISGSFHQKVDAIPPQP